jgi:hypothetical protein
MDYKPPENIFQQFANFSKGLDEDFSEIEYISLLREEARNVYTIIRK